MRKLHRSAVDQSAVVWSVQICLRIPYLAIAVLAAALAFTAQQNPAQTQNDHRVDIPFTRAIVTPHISWGLPSARPPIHAFIVPSVTSGRTLTELAERIPLSFHTVMIDEDWSPNTYIGFDRDYEARTYPVVSSVCDTGFDSPRKV
jgi:hypothetical protein